MKCYVCEEDVTTIRLTAAREDGTPLDTVHLCRDCFRSVEGLSDLLSVPKTEFQPKEASDGSW